MQGFRDILAGSDEAREWLYSDDFETCCTLASAEHMSEIRLTMEQALRKPMQPLPRRAA